MNLYFDTEFTGLHQKTTLISIGIISDDGKTFYAEFTDYNKDDVDDWLEENVIKKLKFNNIKNNAILPDGVVGDTIFVKKELVKYLSQFDTITMWSDCLSYDWVLFNNIFGTAFDIPENVYYIPMDICTYFECKHIDPDISREEFANINDKTEKHNALYDAKIIKLCYDKLCKIL